MSESEETSSLPTMVLPDLNEGGYAAFDELSRTYLLSAELLWRRDLREGLGLVAPVSYNLALGIELFLKARLLELNYTYHQLRDFGHDIDRMWQLPCFAVLRNHAQEIAEQCVQIKNGQIPDPKIWTIDWSIEYLSKLYGKDTYYSLRYPKGKAQVPYPQPMLWVMYELIDNPKYWRSDEAQA